MKDNELKNLFKIIEKLDSESMDENILSYEIVSSCETVFISDTCGIPERKFRCNYTMNDGSFRWIALSNMGVNIALSELTDKFTSMQLDQIDQNIEESHNELQRL